MYLKGIVWRGAKPEKNLSNRPWCWTTHLVNLKQTWEDTNKMNLSNMKFIIAYLNQYTRMETKALWDQYVYIVE